MTRSLVSPSAGSTIVDKLKPYEGGTGQTSAIAALAAMDAIALTQINIPGGIAGLDANGQVLVGQIPDNGIATIGLLGSTTIGYNAPATYVITNYDRFTTYTLSALSGTVYREKDTITYTPPAAAGACGFILNGKTFNITAVGAQPLAPTLAVALSYGANVKATLTTSAYGVTFGTYTHLNTDWQIATDTAFSSIVASSMADASNKTTWSINTLSLSTTYYFRARHRDSNGSAGAWSDIQNLTSKANYNISLEEAKLLASDPTSGDRFGWCVSMSADGSRVIVGSPYKVTTVSNQGAAYVFSRTGGAWAQEAKLIASDPAVSDLFGQNVSISGDGTRVSVGAYNKTGSVANQGAVYVYLRTGTSWAQEQKLIAGDPVANDQFGYTTSLSLDGSRVAISARTKTGTAGTLQGAVYVFLRTAVTWAQEAKLVQSDPASGDYFGFSLVMSSDSTRLIAGTLYKTGTAGANQGAAYIYLRTGTSWAQEQKLLASDPAANDYFGYAVTMSSDGLRVGIGAYGKTGTASTQGAVYIFLRTGTTWALEQKLLAADPAAGDYFGFSVSMTADGSRLAIGAYQKIGTVAPQGAMYTFNRSGVTWSQASKVVSSDPVASEYFGWCVCFAADGTRTIAGAYNKNGTATGQGAAYIDV